MSFLVLDPCREMGLALVTLLEGMGAIALSQTRWSEDACEEENIELELFDVVIVVARKLLDGSKKQGSQSPCPFRTESDRIADAGGGFVDQTCIAR